MFVALQPLFLFGRAPGRQTRKRKEQAPPAASRGLVGRALESLVTRVLPSHVVVIWPLLWHSFADGHLHPVP